MVWNNVHDSLYVVCWYCCCVVDLQMRCTANEMQNGHDPSMYVCHAERICFVCLKLVICYNETALLKHNKKYEIHGYSISIGKNVTLQRYSIISLNSFPLFSTPSMW